MRRLLLVVPIALLPLPAAAAGDESLRASLTELYLVFGLLPLAAGYGFSGLRARRAIVGALKFAVILFAALWPIYGLEKALQVLFLAGALALLFAPMLALGVYLGRRRARRTLTRKLATSHGN
jgi:hypothetical protein